MEEVVKKGIPPPTLTDTQAAREGKA